MARRWAAGGLLLLALLGSAGGFGEKTAESACTARATQTVTLELS